LHELHGKFKGIWSISITNNYRIIFARMENGDILFISIGKHDIYKYL
jgi:addiction module RelE/StbE family toxin